MRSTGVLHIFQLGMRECDESHCCLMHSTFSPTLNAAQVLSGQCGNKVYQGDKARGKKKCVSAKGN